MLSFWEDRKIDIRSKLINVSNNYFKSGIYKKNEAINNIKQLILLYIPLLDWKI